MWKNDKIQFARLLCEIRMAGGLTDSVRADLMNSMDLDEDELQELLDRADKVWGNTKG